MNRRDALKTIGLAAAATVVPLPAVSAPVFKARRKLKVVWSAEADQCLRSMYYIEVDGVLREALLSTENNTRS